MSTDIKQETQEVETTETTDVVETISATKDDKTATETEPAQDDKTVELEDVEKEEENVQDVVVDEESNTPAPEKEETPAVEVLNYLDSSILDIRVVNEEDIDQYGEEEIISDELHEKYAETFSDIREKEVVTGTVVGFTDRDVLVDIGFKAEGIIHRSEFEELPEAGQEIDVFIITFEDRKGNIILSKERADFQKRWTEIRNCFEQELLITRLISKRIKGGMVVDLGVVQAFLPGSQVDIKPIPDFDDF